MVMTASVNDSPLMPAIVDISASYSVVNKHAARMAGIENGDGTDLGPYCHSPPVSVWLGKEPESSSSTATRLGSSEASARLHGDARLVSDTRGHGGEALVGSAPSPQQQLTVEALIEGPIPVRELPSLAPLGLADVPVMILGMDILCRWAPHFIAMRGPDGATGNGLLVNVILHCTETICCCLHVYHFPAGPGQFSVLVQRQYTSKTHKYPSTSGLE